MTHRLLLDSGPVDASWQPTSPITESVGVGGEYVTTLNPKGRRERRGCNALFVLSGLSDGRFESRETEKQGRTVGLFEFRIACSILNRYGPRTGPKDTLVSRPYGPRDVWRRLLSLPVAVRTAVDVRPPPGSMDPSQVTSRRATCPSLGLKNRSSVLLRPHP